MTKREYCATHESVAYWSGIGGVEIKGIEYGIDDFIYCVSNAWYGVKSFHRVKIQSTMTGRSFIMVHGYRIYLDECLRMGV